MPVLRALSEFYVLSSTMIHRICFRNHRDARTIRRRLARLVADGYIRRSITNVAISIRNAGPVYSPTERGCEALAVYTGDDTWLATNTRPPRIDRLYHWLDISHVHATLREAVARQPAVKRFRWINEWQPVGDEDGRPTIYVLHTQFAEGKNPLSCSPDAAFLLDVNGERRVHYVELDRATNGARRTIASKVKGFAELARTQGHRRHFPETNFDEFTVLLITINRGYRDLLALKRTGSAVRFMAQATRNDRRGTLQDRSPGCCSSMTSSSRTYSAIP